MLRALTAALIVFAASSLLAQSPPASLPSLALPPELDRVLRDYEKAWQARDPATLAGLFSEDGFVLANGQPPARGREAIAAAYTGHGGPLALRALAFSTDGSTGWIVGAYAGAADKPDDGKFVLALRRVEGRWMIAADIDNSNRRASAPPPADPTPASR